MTFIGTQFYTQEQVDAALFGQLSDLVGQESTKQLSNALESLGVYEQENLWSKILSIVILIFTATTVFTTLQSTLNKIFEVEPVTEKSTILEMAKSRVLSFGLILTFAFILLVTMTVNTLLAAIIDYLDVYISELSIALTLIASIVIPFIVVTLLFATIFKWLPDLKIKWKDTWIGALITSSLFLIGRFGISFYIGQSDPSNLYDAAGGLIIIMVWVFYTSIIFFFGASITYTRMKFLNVVPESSSFAEKKNE